MASEMEELLEQAETEATELTEQIQAATKIVNDIVDSANDVDEKVKNETEDLQKTLKELTARLDSAQKDIEGARQAAETELEAVTTKANLVKGELADLVTNVKKSLAELETTKNDVQQSVESGYKTAGDDFQELNNQIGDYQKLAEEGLDKGKKAVQACRDAIQAAREALSKKHLEWVDVTSNLSEAASEQVNAWVRAAGELLEKSGRAMIDSANEVIDRHNKSMEKLKTKFDTEADEELGKSLKALEDKLTAIGTKAEGRTTELGTKAQEILDAISNLLPEIETAKNQMATAKRLS